MKTLFFHAVFTFSVIFLFSSCSKISADMGWMGLVVISVLMLGLFAITFYYIFKSKRKAEKSLVLFSANVQQMLDKIDSPDKRIKSLKTLIGRINEDEKYKKDTSWRDKVLARTYLHLATQYYDLGDTNNMLATCTKILELTPDDAMTLYNRGSIYSNMGEYEKSLTDLNRSIELVDDYASSYNNRGMILSKQGKLLEALNDFDRAIELEESAVSYYNRGNVYKELKNKGNAIKDYEMGLELCDEEDLDLKSEITKAKEDLLLS